MKPTGMHCYRSYTDILLSLALVAMAASSVDAQQTTRSLSGTVTDRGHEPLRGAVVQLENGSTHSVMSFITGRSGQYSFKRIDGDTDYTVSAAYRGTQAKSKQLDKFNTKKNPTINLVIEMQH